MGRVTVPIFPACRFGSPTDAASDEICVFPRKLRTNNRRSERRNTTDEAPKTTTSMARSSTNSAVTPAAHAPRPKKNSTNTGDTSSTASKIMPRINHMAATDTAPSSFFEYTPQRKHPMRNPQTLCIPQRKPRADAIACYGRHGHKAPFGIGYPDLVCGKQLSRTEHARFPTQGPHAAGTHKRNGGLGIRAAASRQGCTPFPRPAPQSPTRRTRGHAVENVHESLPASTSCLPAIQIIRSASPRTAAPIRQPIFHAHGTPVNSPCPPSLRNPGLIPRRI